MNTHALRLLTCVLFFAAPLSAHPTSQKRTHRLIKRKTFEPSEKRLRVVTLSHKDGDLPAQEGKFLRDFVRDMRKGKRSGHINIPHNDSPKIVAAHEGIALHENDEHATILLRGYAPWPETGQYVPRVGGGIVAGCRRLKNNIIHEKCVTADFPNDIQHLNFGQNHDRRSTKFLYESVKKQSPNTRIMMVGECLGSISTLHFLAHEQPENVDAVVLESLFASVEDLLAGTIAPYYGERAAKMSHKALGSMLPSYCPNCDNVKTKLDRINGKKIFIACRVNDWMIDHKRVRAVADELAKRNTVYFFSGYTGNGEHGGLHEEPACQEALNYFFKISDRPHNAELAQRASRYFNGVKENGMEFKLECLNMPEQKI